MVPPDKTRLDSLTGSDKSATLAALQGMSIAELEHPEFMQAVVAILRQDDVIPRYIAARLLLNAACHGVDIAPAVSTLESLFTDDRAPEDIAAHANHRWHTVSAEARQAVARFRLGHNDVAALSAMLAEPGWPGAHAMVALQGVTELQLEPYLPLLKGLLVQDEVVSSSDNGPARRRLASRALARLYLRRQDWDAMNGLLLHPNEDARRGAYRVLDDAAEEGLDIDPVLPALLSIFQNSGADAAETRRDAANVLVWFVLRKTKRPKALVLSGVDVLALPEVRVALTELKRFAKRAARDR